MVAAGEEEPDARLIDAAADGLRRQVEADAERFEHVRRAALARDRPVSVLGYSDARRGDDERDRCRDVERLENVAARPAGVHERIARGGNAERAVAPGAGEA